MQLIDGSSVPLVYAACNIRNEAVLKKLLELNPAALQCFPYPFYMAVGADNEVAIELMQSHLTFGEIMDAFVAAKKSLERYRPMVESQCESLLVLLNRDAFGLVCEYLGFKTRVETKFTKQ